MKVRNIINNNGNAARNQFVITSGDATFFQSYDSVVAMIRRGKLYVTPLWDYSNTTRKHFYIFVNDYFRYGKGNRESILEGIADGSICEVEDGELDL